MRINVSKNGGGEFWNWSVGVKKLIKLNFKK
jgi:hypothetical protein